MLGTTYFHPCHFWSRVPIESPNSSCKTACSYLTSGIQSKSTYVFSSKSGIYVKSVFFQHMFARKSERRRRTKNTFVFEVEPFVSDFQYLVCHLYPHPTIFPGSQQLSSLGESTTRPSSHFCVANEARGVILSSPEQIPSHS